MAPPGSPDEKGRGPWLQLGTSATQGMSKDSQVSEVRSGPGVGAGIHWKRRGDRRELGTWACIRSARGLLPVCVGVSMYVWNVCVMCGWCVCVCVCMVCEPLCTGSVCVVCTCLYVHACVWAGGCLHMHTIVCTGEECFSAHLWGQSCWLGWGRVGVNGGGCR